MLLQQSNLNLDFFLRRFDTGPIKAKDIAAGTIVPDTANKKVVALDKPNSSPNGMASFNSKKGTIAVKKTISSVFISTFKL